MRGDGGELYPAVLDWEPAAAPQFSGLAPGQPEAPHVDEPGDLER